MKTLLRLEEVNPEKTDTYGRTQLSHAARSSEALRILLGRKEVNPGCNGICLLFSLLYLPDVGCFLFRFYNSSAAFPTLYFLYFVIVSYWVIYS